MEPAQGRHGQPRCHRKCRTPKPDRHSADEDRKRETPSPPPPPDGNCNALFAAVTNLNAYLIAALLLFSGNTDPPTPAARRAEY